MAFAKIQVKGQIRLETGLHNWYKQCFCGNWGY